MAAFEYTGFLNAKEMEFVLLFKNPVYSKAATAIRITSCYVKCALLHKALLFIFFLLGFYRDMREVFTLVDNQN